jgi:signal transduction histidine kinase
MKNNLLCMAAFLWLLILPFVVFSQKRGPDLIDSLEKAIARYGEDSNKALTLLRLGNAFAVVDLNKAFPPVNEGLRISEKLHYTKGIANAENNLGLYMSDTGNPAGARPHFERSYTLNVQLNSKLNIVNNLVNIGRTWSYESNFPKAIDYFFKGLTVAEAIKSEQKMAFVGNNLASNFIKQQNWPKAFEYGQYTVDHAAKVGDISSLGKGYVFMGNSKGSMGDTAAAIRWTDSAIAVDKRANLLVDLTAAQGDRALFESDPARRIQMELDDETLITKVSPNSDIAFMVKELIGYDYFVLAKQATTAEKARLLKNADDYLTKAKAMAEARNNPARLAEVLQRAAELEEYEGQYKTALADRKRITAINDSLFSQENKNKIAGLETKHAVALKDAELALGELKLTNERRTTIGLIVGLGVMGLLGVLLYRQSRSRQKANAALREANLELEEANRVKARFFGILSHDLRGPVANLLHFLEIQKEAPDFLNEEQQVVHRREISASAENLLNTMEGMLLWSKQQMQSFKPVPKNTRVDELFDYVGKYVGEPEKVKLVFQPVDGLTVFTDENYLRVIMQNLTSNAIKVLKDRPDASIEWKAKKEGDHTVLSIADNGPGLGVEQAKTLYEESVAENARDGFGLHIIRDLAKAIRCRVDVRSEPGKGTEFSLILPAVA